MSIQSMGQPINLTDEQRTELERRVRSQTLDARSVRRARIVLLAAEGAGNHEIARRLEIIKADFDHALRRSALEPAA